MRWSDSRPPAFLFAAAFLSTRDPEGRHPTAAHGWSGSWADSGIPCLAKAMNSSELTEYNNVLASLPTQKKLAVVFRDLRQNRPSCEELAPDKERVNAVLSFVRYLVLLIRQIVKWKTGLMQPTAARSYTLVGRYVFTQLRTLKWFFHCKEAEMLIKISLVLMFTLNLEDERACILQMLFDVFGAGVTPLEKLSQNQLDMLTEFSVMREPYWEVEDTDALLGEMERREQTTHPMIKDLKSFLASAPEVRRVKKGEREEALRRLEAGEDLGELAPSVMFSDVPRVHARDLTFKRFFEEFEMLRKPVIIEGLNFGLKPEAAWSEMRELCGDIPLDRLQRTAECCDWSSLEYFTTNLTLAEWMDTVAAGGASDGRVLFDFTLMTDVVPHELCPEFNEKLVIPRYFTMDLSKRAPWFPEEWGSLDPFGGHPAVFVQPEGTNIFWHSDHLNANFWQVLFVGRKRWRLMPIADQRERMIWLCEHPTLRFAASPDGDQPIEPVPYSGIFPKDPEQHCPLWKKAVEKGLFKTVEVETFPGDTIFIPSGVVHQTTQLESSLALSMNYVDDSNLDDFFEASDDADTGYTREQFIGPKAPLLLREPVDLPWSDYARGPRPWEAFIASKDRLHLDKAVCEESPLKEAHRDSTASTDSNEGFDDTDDWD